MARMKRGILGGLSGKVANVVGTSWKGIEALRSLPLSVANPNTPAQQQQRGRFSQAVATAQVWLTNTIKPLWDRFAQQQSGFNAWIQANIDAFTESGLDSPADLIISRGSLHLDSPSVSSAASGTAEAEVSWNPQGGNSDDEAYVVGYNETQDVYGTPGTDRTRTDGSRIVQFGDNNFAQGDVLHFWLAFRRADGRQVSDTGYVTDTVS